MIISINTSTTSFIDFIIKDTRNRKYLLLALGGAILQFILFKILYPFPDFFSDSYSYIYASDANLSINILPIGYSKFLTLFHKLTYSGTALICFQYLFLEISALFFFFTLLYFYAPSQTNKVVLFIFLLFNPIFLYISNHISNDSLFIALSLLWLTQLFWIILRPYKYHFITQAILLLICITISNRAWFYPIITILAISLSRQKLWIKFAGSLLGFVLIIAFILKNRDESYKMTSTTQFSFSLGWQLANNALYMYEYTDSASFQTPQSQALDKLSRRFYSKFSGSFRDTYIITEPDNFFMRWSFSPLKKYTKAYYKPTDRYSNIVAWGKASPVFADYGRYLIQHNLGAYLWEFALPNAKRYFIPPMENLDGFTKKKEKRDSIAQIWFHFQTYPENISSKNLQGYTLCIFPFLFLLGNIYLLGNIALLFFKKEQILLDPLYTKSMFLAFGFLFINFFFTVFSTIIVFRYEILPLLLCISFSLLLTEWLYKNESHRKIAISTAAKNDVIIIQKGISLQ